MHLLIAVFWLLLVFIVWTFLLISNPFGWYRIYLAVRSIWDKNIRAKAFQRWKRDDELINEWFGGRTNHTISGRIGFTAIHTGKATFSFMEKIINALFWFDEHHCFKSINWQLYPPELRDKLTRKYFSKHRIKELNGASV